MPFISLKSPFLQICFFKADYIKPFLSYCYGRQQSRYSWWLVMVGQHPHLRSVTKIYGYSDECAMSRCARITYYVCTVPAHGSSTEGRISIRKATYATRLGRQGGRISWLAFKPVKLLSLADHLQCTAVALSTQPFSCTCHTSASTLDVFPIRHTQTHQLTL